VSAAGLLAGLAGCGSLSVFKPQAQEAVAVPERALSRPVDDSVLRFRLTAQQPEWPTGRLPAAPGFRQIDCARVKCVALTFDDGPGEYGTKVLDALAAHGARATFFLIGQNITPKTRSYLARIVAEGHEIGNHTWDHADLTKLSAGKLRAELAHTTELIKAFTGVTPQVLRPPYGYTNRRVSDEAKRQGMAQIMWSIDTNDWHDHNPALVAKRTEAATPGSIVLLHEIQKTTVEAVPRILDQLDRKGFTYVTVSELFGQHYLTAGGAYQRFDKA
jgi:Predicted xylanase/chitin deacetylase